MAHEPQIVHQARIVGRERSALQVELPRVGVPLLAEQVVAYGEVVVTIQPESKRLPRGPLSPFVPLAVGKSKGKVLPSVVVGCVSSY